MSLIRLGFWAASGAGVTNYWIATLGGAANDFGKRLSSDSLQNLYYGYRQDSSAGISKRDKDGAMQWQRTLSGASLDQVKSIAVDSSNNVFITGETSSEGEGGSDLLLAKYNSSGVIQWQRILGGTGSDPGESVATDSLGNAYVIGFTDSGGAGGNDWILAKYNSAGTIQFQVTLGGTGSEQGFGIAFDSSDNFFAFGKTTSEGEGGNDMLLAKYNSSGVIQWQRILGGTGTENGEAVAVDSAGDVYMTGYTTSETAGSADFFIVKYSNSGVLQWQRRIGGAGFEVGYGIATDKDNNVYICGDVDSQGAGSDDGFIAKYDSSGTIQWQRTLGSTASDKFYGVVIDSKGSVCLSGETQGAGEGSRDVFSAKLPNNGSLTGTYVLDTVDFVYAASTLTTATTTLTGATSSLTSSTSTLTAATSTLTDSASSLTSHFVEIPA
jgi:uncharacterized delta-60 repeat protein